MPKGQVKQQIDLNSANVEELSRLKAIGRTRAQALVEYRNKNGLFESWDDLEDVDGFSGKIIQDLKESGATLGEMEEQGEAEDW